MVFSQEQIMKRETVRFYKIQYHLQSEIDAVISELLKDAGLPGLGMEGFITSTERGQSVRARNGRGKKNQRLLCVPLWAYEKGRGYFIYCVSHELAHQFENSGTKHNSSFYCYFNKLCPKEYQHHEFSYIKRSQKLLEAF